MWPLFRQFQIFIKNQNAPTWLQMVPEAWRWPKMTRNMFFSFGSNILVQLGSSEELNGAAEAAQLAE
jgi:hypothetical protein